MAFPWAPSKLSRSSKTCGHQKWTQFANTGLLVYATEVCISPFRPWNSSGISVSPDSPQSFSASLLSRIDSAMLVVMAYFLFSRHIELPCVRIWLGQRQLGLWWATRSDYGVSKAGAQIIQALGWAGGAENMGTKFQRRSERYSPKVTHQRSGMESHLRSRSGKARSRENQRQQWRQGLPEQTEAGWRHAWGLRFQVCLKGESGIFNGQSSCRGLGQSH